MFKEKAKEKGSLDVTGLDKVGFKTYLQVCADCLARAHARTGDAAAIADFAVAFADQTERDHKALVEAIESGRIVAETGI